MLCYFFHVRGPQGFLPDAEGAELPDLQAARRLASNTIKAMAGNPLVEDYAEWVLELTDEGDRTLLTIPFQTELGPPIRPT